MYPETKKIIAQKMKAKIFSGTAFYFREKKQSEENIWGKAATDPTGILLEPDFLFDVASLTKVVCTTSVMLKLFEAKKIDWDTPLHELYPAFKNQAITLRHLLTHTSDIQTYIPNRNQLSAAELKAAYLTLEPGDKLGQEVKYTDAGTILLGFLIEELYQKNLVEIFQEIVLKPLKMNQSQFLPQPPYDKIVPTEKIQGEVLKGQTHDPKARKLAEHAGNAGLFTNLADLEKFVAMYLQQGQDFLQPATIASLFKDQTPDGQGRRSLGWDLEFSPLNQRPLIFHTGYTGTFILLDVQQQSAFIFLSNRVHPHDFREAYIKERDEIIATYLSERSQKYFK